MKYNLELLSNRRAQIKSELAETESRIVASSMQIFQQDDYRSKSKKSSFSLERIVAAYDAFMLGYRLYHRFSGVFKAINRKRR